MIFIQLRKTLRATGPGHSVDRLHTLGFKDGVCEALDILVRRLEVTRIGKYYWLNAQEGDRAYSPR
jgi:hypothetical protein